MLAFVICAMCFSEYVGGVSFSLVVVADDWETPIMSWALITHDTMR